MGYQHKQKQYIEDIVIFHYRSRKVPSYLYYVSIFTEIECIVMAYITLYGYSKEMIKSSAKKANTTEQVIRNTVSKLIKRGELRRLGKYNVQIII